MVAAVPLPGIGPIRTPLPHDRSADWGMGPIAAAPGLAAAHGSEIVTNG